MKAVEFSSLNLNFNMNEKISNVYQALLLLFRRTFNDKKATFTQITHN